MDKLIGYIEHLKNYNCIVEDKLKQALENDNMDSYYYGAGVHDAVASIINALENIEEE